MPTGGTERFDADVRAAEARARQARGQLVTLAEALPWVKAIELKDMSTAAHTWRVVLYIRALGEAFGIEHEQIERICVAAALHDIGKLRIPDEILQKPGRLTDEEFEVIKTHSAHGHEMLLEIGVDDQIALNLVRHHHERWDGAGYPDKLAGEAIPLGARYFAVIDSFDALTSVRTYRRDIGEGAAERALEELERNIGTRYWADAVRAFGELYRAGELTWILHYFNDEVPVPRLGGLVGGRADADAPALSGGINSGDQGE